MDSKRTDIEKAITFISGAVEIAPVYYITGNHENWLEKDVREELLNQIKEAGAYCVSNEALEIMHKGDSFTLIGLDDANLTDGTLGTITAEAEQERFTLLLAHQPQYLESYSQYPVDLVLSGHAHGGQVRLPFLGGLVAPDQGFLPKYTAGEYVSGNTTMIVSRGLGNSIIPIRVFNFPEIVFIELK